ncbi:MFS transporter [uncultured Jatrophihabitans sp.]|uniref:MFS transporter n=1 Tax=uncultured Jatrophihabitans sp. TaxID=1610747 RepID=UPI0035CAC9DC
MTATSATAGPTRPDPAGAARASRPTRRTELDRYPTSGRRFLCLAIVVIATIVLYYQFYLAGAVAAGTNGKNGILVDTHMSFVFYVNISVVGYLLGAAASFVTGVADRVGRVNIVTAGLVVVALLCLLGIPLADSKMGFAVVFAAIGLVEGMILVATPALIRDFSPQLGRASAMGFWTLGPVLGSLVVSLQISNTSVTTPWHDQYIAAGIAGLVIAALSAVFLRELTPGLRDQLMVSARDRALVEARAKGIDVEASLNHPFRQMLKPDIVLSAFAISVFLIIYYVAVGFFPVYFQTIFGFSQSKANALGNWTWAFDAGALLVIGFLSDKLRVRKPFMVLGALGAILMTVLFALRATHPDTSYSTFVVLVSLLAVFLGVAYAPWMASFTETVEKRNPALAATGLAVWGLVIRIVIAASVFIVPHVVNTVSTLVEDGGTAQAIAAAHPVAVKAASTLQAKDPATAAALAKTPGDLQAGVKAVSVVSGVPVGDVTTIATLNAQHAPAIAAAKTIDSTTITTLLTNKTDASALTKAVQEVVTGLKISPAQAQARIADLATIPTPQLLLLQTSGQKVLNAQDALTKFSEIPAAQRATLAKAAAAAEQSPKQWRNYFWIAVGGEVVFIPLIFLLTGFWSPKRARRAEQEHEQWVDQQLAELGNR